MVIKRKGCDLFRGSKTEIGDLELKLHWYLYKGGV